MKEFSLGEEGGNKDWKIAGTDLPDRVSCLATRSDVFVFPVVIDLVAVACYVTFMLFTLFIDVNVLEIVIFG